MASRKIFVALLSSEDRAPLDCCQMEQQNRGESGAPPTSPERVDLGDYEQGFVWLVLVFASNVQTSWVAGEADWPGILLRGPGAFGLFTTFYADILDRERLLNGEWLCCSLFAPIVHSSP